jgi:DNA (cytosine-5)-methyltransferase 1
MTDSVAVVDFFSGCGGTSLGLRDAGFEIIAGLDNDPDAAETFRSNFSEASFIERDIRKVTVEDVAALIPSGGPTLFSGCAPCQPFSKQNRFRSSRPDPKDRYDLLTEFQKFVSALLPEFVVIENVPGLQKVGTSGPFARFLDVLKRHQYRSEWSVLPASNFGVPQTRRRLVLVAARNRPVRLPSAEYGPRLKPFSVVRDYIWGLPPLRVGEVNAEDPDHAAMDLSELNLRRISATAEGKGRESWPSDLILDCHRGHNGHTDVYGRLAWDKQASAITTRCLSYSNGRYGHPVENRAISLREAACLQTFPRTFFFSGSLLSKGRQVGNAVPPLLAKAIGSAILKAIE